MSRELILLQDSDSIHKAAQILAIHHVDGAPVVDKNRKLRGLISNSHIIRAVSNDMDLSAPVASIMTTDVTTISLEEDILPLQDSTISRLPVLEDGKIVGIICRSDLIAGYAEYVKQISNQLDFILNAIHNPILAIDQKGYITLYNQAFARDFNLHRDKIINHFLKDIWPSSTLLEIIQTGKAELLQKIRMGEKTYISNHSPIYIGKEIVGAVAVLQDISEFEAISQELTYTKTVSEELNAIIDSSFDGIFVTDGKAKVLKVNRAYERITGLKAADLIGKTMPELIAAGYYDLSVTMEIIQTKRQLTIIQEVQGGKKTILVTGTPAFDKQGNIFRVVTNVRDITELNQLQRDLDKMHGLKTHYQQELAQLQKQVRGQDEFIVRSKPMKEIMGLAIRLGSVDSTVLIQGESGVGKELVAESIHKHSKRLEHPYIKINCAAIPENLLETELFGYEGGTFTGARKEGKAGIFELANLGTLFMDEIGEISANLQVKLLRVLQERVIVRVGGVKPIAIDVRIIAATNRNLEQMTREKLFRKDLFYRLNVVPLVIPPLRDRKDDIPALADYFLEKYNQRYSLHKELSPELMSLLCQYAWPGNVRELQNIIERLVVMAPQSILRQEDLADCLKPDKNNTDIRHSEDKPLKQAVEDLEKNILTQAFKKYGTTRKVAEKLGINQSTVVRKASRYGLNVNLDGEDD